MLVVMHYWDIKVFLQTLFYIETLGSLDVLKIDTTKWRGYALNCLTELFRVFLVNFDIKDINTSVDFE